MPKSDESDYKIPAVYKAAEKALERKLEDRFAATNDAIFNLARAAEEELEYRMFAKNVQEEERFPDKNLKPEFRSQILFRARQALTQAIVLDDDALIKKSRRLVSNAYQARVEDGPRLDADKALKRVERDEVMIRKIVEEEKVLSPTTRELRGRKRQLKDLNDPLFMDEFTTADDLILNTTTGKPGFVARYNDNQDRVQVARGIVDSRIEELTMRHLGEGYGKAVEATFAEEEQSRKKPARKPQR